MYCFTRKRKELLQYSKIYVIFVRLLFTQFKPSLSFIFFHSFIYYVKSRKVTAMKQKIPDVQRYGHGRFSPSAEHKKIIKLDRWVGQ